MFAIFKKEIKSYFYSPIAYIIIGFFVLIISVLFFIANVINMSADFSSTISTASFLLVIIIPILTMRLIAEDRKSGVEVILITSPVSIGKIVLGKYFAALTIFLVMTVITIIFPVIMSFFGTIAVPQIISTYLGFILLGAALISIGIFASSLTENQIIAVVIAFVIMLVTWIISPVATYAGGIIATVLNWISLPAKFNNFTSGILDLSDVIYFISFIAIFIFLTIRMIEKRRWSQG